MSKELVTLLTAMAPLGELRVALPIALATYKLDLVWAYLLSVAGNMIPVFFLLLFWRYGAQLLRKIKIFDIFFERLEKRVTNKFTTKHKKWGKWALLIFVAIPLPTTGAWTGSLAAWLFGFKYWESLGLIFAGVCLAGIIVSLITLGGVFIL